MVATEVEAPPQAQPKAKIKAQRNKKKRGKEG
jgi:hypothetical protein